MALSHPLVMENGPAVEINDLIANRVENPHIWRVFIGWESSGAGQFESFWGAKGKAGEEGWSRILILATDWQTLPLRQE